MVQESPDDLPPALASPDRPTALGGSNAIQEDAESIRRRRRRTFMYLAALGQSVVDDTGGQSGANSWGVVSTGSVLGSVDPGNVTTT
jgi:hypothetical protein